MTNVEERILRNQQIILSSLRLLNHIFIVEDNSSLTNSFAGGLLESGLDIAIKITGKVLQEEGE